MATTTNFGWNTPDNTDLVKDGALAIRTLGSAIDTSLVDLKGGTTGQVLSKATNTDMDFSWTNVASGGITLIQETVASANSSISFTGIAGTYKQLVLVYAGIRHSGTGSEFSVRLNNNSSAIYHISGVQFTNGSGATAASSPTSIAGQSATVNSFSFGKSSSNAAISTDVKGYILIDNYASTTRFKPIVVQYAYYDAAADGYAAVNTMSLFASTTAVTSVDIVRLSGAATISNTANTSIRLYGVS